MNFDRLIISAGLRALTPQGLPTTIICTTLRTVHGNEAGIVTIDLEEKLLLFDGFRFRILDNAHHSNDLHLGVSGCMGRFCPEKFMELTHRKEHRWTPHLKSVQVNGLLHPDRKISVPPHIVAFRHKRQKTHADYFPMQKPNPMTLSPK